jgi:glycolate oxidase FAD binding subunit
MSVHSPRDASDALDAIRAALAVRTPLEIVGRGSRRAFGRPMETAARLDLSALAGVRIYEPAELVLTAGPATPLSELEALLKANGQQLAFEPPDLGPLWGVGEATGSLGGALSVGLGGPRRPFAGAP